MSAVDCSLQIKHLKESQAGFYTCEASNGFHSVTSTGFVRVQAPGTAGHPLLSDPHSYRHWPDRHPRWFVSDIQLSVHPWQTPFTDYPRSNSRWRRTKVRSNDCTVRSILGVFVNRLSVRTTSRSVIWSSERSKRTSSSTWNWSPKNADVFSCRWFVCLSIHSVISNAYTSDPSADNRVSTSRIIRARERSPSNDGRQLCIPAVSSKRVLQKKMDFDLVSSFSSDLWEFATRQWRSLVPSDRSPSKW